MNRELDIMSNEMAVNLTRYIRGSVVVKALCYKPEGRGFETRGGE
jgi:hypothetical protein